MGRAFRRLFWRFAWVFLLLLWAIVALLGFGRAYWMQSLEEAAEREVRAQAPVLGAEIARGTAPDEARYREWIARDARVGYVVVANFRTGYRSGLMNSTGLADGARPVVDFLLAHKDAETLTRLIQKDAGFAGPYLDVYSVALLPPPSASEQTPLGAVKVAYLFPGYPFGRGYFKIWRIVLFGAAALTLLVVAGWASGAPARAGAGGEEKPVASVELEELETALRDEPTVILDEQGRPWHVLFDGKDLTGWRPQEQAYVAEHEIALQPWASSVVHEFFDRPEAYQFQLRARKLAGPDGVILLFNCGAHDLAWVIGGWRNQFSELTGYEATRTALTLERGAWYKIEIKVSNDTVEGWVNDRTVWSLPRAAVRSSSPDLGFQKGIGVAVWNTLAKFKDLRLLEL